MAEEVLPLGVGGGAVLLGGAQGAAAGDEGAVGFDRLGGVDRVVAHGGVDVGVAGDDLRDVGWQAGADGVGDELIEAAWNAVVDNLFWVAVGSSAW
ncbi:hypothetical protein [Streptomyces sp. TBY4]|uniref:hypothetical protein n=1 Tax=Streptomyces sp. TBY4 TaxID=2962030 RepID=UPI0020B7785B|nr:hypothetical protein [Streptomyces sp. TBY4]MCP3759384.1 hypothetical protein [Streptomyces sp. TBY4]